MKPGDRLPSTRRLADSLGVARNTVTAAYRRLVEEGWCEARAGRGTTVALRTHVRRAEAWASDGLGKDSSARMLPEASSVVGVVRKAARFHVQSEEPLAVVSPDFDSLPGRKWTQIVARISKSPWMHNSYCAPGGWPPFKQVLSDYLRETRGIRCEPEQVIVTTGIQQGLDLCARVLFEPGDIVAHENPNFDLHRTALQFARLKTLPVKVDEEGLRVEALESVTDDVRGLLLTPSHQYPMGAVLSLERRKRLLAWAAAKRAWIIEDDYDSELRYGGAPYPALAALECPNENVAYLGSFTKMIYPGFHIGYLIAPPSVQDAFVGAKMVTDRHTSEVHQAILCEFIAGGHYEAHIRKLKTLYEERRRVAIRSIGRYLSDLGHLVPCHQGTHLTFIFDREVDDVKLSEYLRTEHRLETRPLSPCYVGENPRSGLLLGFAGFTTTSIDAAVERLARAIQIHLATQCVR